MSQNLFFDIETAPLDIQTVCQIMPVAEKFDRSLLGDEGILDEALLHATRSTVCAIGIINDSDIEPSIIHDLICSESEIIGRFWEILSDHVSRSLNKWVFGWGIRKFDFPFLIRRSWILGVDVPKWTYDYRGNVCGRLIDLKQVWRLSDDSCRHGLNEVAKAMFGVGKFEDMSGTEFHKLLHSGNQESVDRAIAYLNRDVKLVRTLANSFRLT